MNVIENKSQTMDTARHIPIECHMDVSGICRKTGNKDAASMEYDISMA